MAGAANVKPLGALSKDTQGNGRRYANSDVVSTTSTFVRFNQQLTSRSSSAKTGVGAYGKTLTPTSPSLGPPTPPLDTDTDGHPNYCASPTGASSTTTRRQLLHASPTRRACGQSPTSHHRGTPTNIDRRTLRQRPEPVDRPISPVPSGDSTIDPYEARHRRSSLRHTTHPTLLR